MYDSIPCCTTFTYQLPRFPPGLESCAVGKMVWFTRSYSRPWYYAQKLNDATQYLLLQQFAGQLQRFPAGSSRSLVLDVPVPSFQQQQPSTWFQRELKPKDTRRQLAIKVAIQLLCCDVYIRSDYVGVSPYSTWDRIIVISLPLVPISELQCIAVKICTDLCICIGRGAL